MLTPISHCNRCGHSTEQRIPDDGDTKLRAVCPACGHIQYQNPLVVVGTLPLYFDGPKPKVLLCKRNIEPRFGKWTLPAGFLELGESALEGALRETWEEAGVGGSDSFAGNPLALRPYPQPLFAHFDVLSAGQIYQFFRVEVLNPALCPGPETQEAHYFSEDEIPWDDIAFTAVKEVLTYYFKTCKQDNSETLFASPYQKTL